MSEPESRRTWRRDRPLTAVEVEELIMETLDLLEEAGEAHAAAAIRAKRAEAVYRGVYAKAYTSSTAGTETMKAQQAAKAANQKLQERLGAEGETAGWAEWCRIRREQLGALRTVAANARAAEVG